MRTSCCLLLPCGEFLQQRSQFSRSPGRNRFRAIDQEFGQSLWDSDMTENIGNSVMLNKLASRSGHRQFAEAIEIRLNRCTSAVNFRSPIRIFRPIAGNRRTAIQQLRQFKIGEHCPGVLIADQHSCRSQFAEDHVCVEKGLQPRLLQPVIVEEMYFGKLRRRLCRSRIAVSFLVLPRFQLEAWSTP